MTKELLCPLTFISGRRWPTSAVRSLPAALRSSSPDAEPPLPPAWHARRQGRPLPPHPRFSSPDAEPPSPPARRRSPVLLRVVVQAAGEARSAGQRGGEASVPGLLLPPPSWRAGGGRRSSAAFPAPRRGLPLRRSKTAPPAPPSHAECIRGERRCNPPMQFSSPICIVCWRLCLT
jgi:hypothetical protein